MFILELAKIYGEDNFISHKTVQAPYNHGMLAAPWDRVKHYIDSRTMFYHRPILYCIVYC